MIRNRTLLLALCLLALSLACKKQSEVTYEGKPLRAWLAMLESQDPAERYAAVRAVREIGPEASPAIPILIETIRETRNRDKKLLLACNGALLAMGREIVPHMIVLLRDDSWEMRSGSAWILGKLGPEARDAVPALTRALQDPHPAVRSRAAVSLKQIRGEPVEARRPSPGPTTSGGESTDRGGKEQRVPAPAGADTRVSNESSSSQADGVGKPPISP